MELRRLLVIALLVMVAAASTKGLDSTVVAQQDQAPSTTLPQATAEYSYEADQDAEGQGYDDEEEIKAYLQHKDHYRKHGHKHNHEGQKLKPVGPTYYLSATRRTLTRPATTTLADIAATMPPPIFARTQGSTASAQKSPGGAESNDERELTPQRGTTLGRRQAQVAQQSLGDTSKAEPTAAISDADDTGSVTGNLQGHHHGSHKEHQATARVDLSVDGLNAFNSRFANNGDQVTYDPPDIGLCVGNGFVLETVNTVLRVFDAATGAPLLNPVDFNTFYDYPPGYARTPGIWGPNIQDSQCVFDEDSQRWFITTSFLDVVPDNSNFQTLIGPSDLSIAVSNTADPTGSWKLYRLPTTNNGTEGTPDFGCAGGVCVSEIPQIAVWEHALIIAADESDITSAFSFNGANVYAVDKVALLGGSEKANTALVRSWTKGVIANQTTFGLQPARQVGACSTPNTYLVATNPRKEFYWVRNLLVYKLRGTQTLATQHARVTLDLVVPSTHVDFPYRVPLAATQKPGPIPYGARFYNATSVYKLEVGFGAMGSVSFVDDQLYCAWGTAIEPLSAATAGIAWTVIDPQRPAWALDGGLLRAPGDGNSLAYPYMAVRPGGDGVVSFTLVGPEYFPSPGFAVLSKDHLMQQTIITDGIGPLDSYTGYQDRFEGFAGSLGYYSAAAIDASGAFWVAAEYVDNTCTNDEFDASIRFTCGGVRAAGANWATRITKITLR